jgi:tetratricopeptide (TPR) repeat protein
MRLLLRVLPALVIAGALGAAFAGDSRPVDVGLSDGKSIRGVVESADAKEVVLRLSPEEVRRVPWSALSPLGLYRVKAALAPAADGEARQQLAELAAELGLYAEARAEYEKALALGSLKQEEFERVVGEAERKAVTLGVGAARRAAEAGDLETALEAARRLRLDFTNAPNAGDIRALIDDLLDRVKALDAESVRDAAEIAKAEAELKRNKEILERKNRAISLMDKGDEASERAKQARTQGAQTRARKAAEEAETAYVEARKHLGRLRRILPLADEARKEVIARLNALDEHQFAMLLAMAKFFWDSRSYSRAEEYAAKASYIDPVHPELLELRENLIASRIRYRLSDVTNARPIVR